jgi:hypothetical protein
LPEEVILDSTNEYIIAMENRGNWRGVVNKATGITKNNGISDFVPPKSYLIVETNKTAHTETAIIQVDITPCWYWNFNFDIVNWHSDYPTTLEVSGNMMSYNLL